jgi:hypothetical protein
MMAEREVLKTGAELLNLLAPILNLPERCTGLTLEIDCKSLPRLEVREYVAPSATVSTFQEIVHSYELVDRVEESRCS